MSVSLATHDRVKIRLKELRRSIKCSQRKLAKDLGWSQATVARIDRGVGTISAEKLVQLARYFHCRIDDLFDHV